MFKKLKENKGKIIGNFASVLAGLVIGGIIATANSEMLGYGAFTLYAYGVFGHRFAASFVEKKVK